MKCPEEIMLHRLADGELEPPEKERIQAHVEQCPGCRKVFDEITSLGLAVRTAIETQVEKVDLSSISAGVSDYIARKKQPAPGLAALIGRALKRPALALVSSTAIIVIAIMLFLPGRSGTTEAAIVESISCDDPNICVTYQPADENETTVVYITGLESYGGSNNE
jgi:anti-sigma factor RsiW